MSDAYINAQQPNGKHHGFYRQYRTKSVFILRRAIRSLDRQVAEHELKINQLPALAQVAALSQEHQAGLLKKWRAEIETFREQIAILQGILRERETS